MQYLLLFGHKPLSFGRRLSKMDRIEYEHANVARF